ncbi:MULTISPECIES: S9 family peptidase [Pseudoalteromonas]|uniref:S9 family peptidase n=1 Tax=Pseudoalteromonas TaxID=53246 RepID=UPI00029AB9FD|nr:MULTISPECIES: S9 family peptidase [Pseudoalteromonas]MBR8844160.1 S9 family peptidase [Pseudoalteromonas sp. JC3]MCF2827265.1 S9 family peptidase [Pseudoalteromonas sp. OF5H-5]MCF2831500.1 S9 family peptidase [Pseudoalteromonas sp. DL2-H6]MCF2926423.1 S9 family peptidase [Pseudoalteromonas sp. DL2-H1]MCG7555863.1 S9 family peptidase [Pseudoalteromonas sp. Of11M-6]
MKLLKSALALAMGFTSAASLASDTITIEDIPKIQSVSSTSVSPDGELVAFTRSVPRELYVDQNGSNYSELYVVDDEGVERPFITGKVSISSISWSADGQFIYFLTKKKEDKQRALYRIAVNGGEAQKVLSLKGTGISAYSLSPDGKQVAILAMPAADKSEKELKKLGFMAEVYELGLKNKQLHIIDLAASEKPLTPAALNIEGYVSEINWADDASKLLVKTQPTALIDDKYMKSQWHVLDAKTQQITTSFKTEGKLGTAEFSHDGKYIAILGAEDKHDPATGRLYLADAQSGKVEEWIPNFMGHIGDFEWSNRKNQLTFVANVGAESFVGQIKVGSNKYKKLIKEGKFIASNLSISDSDKTIALRANTAKHPNEVFVIRSSKATRLSNSNPWLDNKRFAKQEAINFKARDGVEIGGVLIYPLDYQEGTRYPLIMSVHGGPESHDKNGWLTSYSDPGQMGAARGYAVFYPNYRGSTGKGVDYSKLGQGDYAGKEFDDLVDMKEYLVNTGLVDTKRVGITGGSYGGYASAWGATKLTEHFAASVMFVGVTNQLSKFGTTDISNEMYLVHARSYPWDKWQWYLERSPIYWAGQSKTPLLIMHGKDDPRVHPAQSMELYRYMKVQGKDVRLVYYPGEGHGNRKAAAQYDYSLRLMRWMDNYLIEGKKDMPDYEIDHAAKLKAVKDANK